jgi:eukaryotic-like serine/threonine-protein kinase
VSGEGLADVVRAPEVRGFRLLALLGHGRRFDTWDAWDEARGARCVLKLVRADRAHEPEVLAAFRREGEAVTSVGHPHLVRGYEVLEAPPGIVLETLRGATLAAVVEEGPLAAGDVAQLVVQVGSALGYLHRHDWLHLDVKPANVVVDHGRAVLIDLSLVQHPGPTRRGSGTPGYQAPEQRRGNEVSAATDVHGLALTALEALRGDPVADVRWRRSLSRTCPLGTPPALAAVLVGALAPRPDDRPALQEVLEVARGLVAD